MCNSSIKTQQNNSIGFIAALFHKREHLHCNYGTSFTQVCREVALYCADSHILQLNIISCFSVVLVRSIAHVPTPLDSVNTWVYWGVAWCAGMTTCFSGCKRWRHD